MTEKRAGLAAKRGFPTGKRTFYFAFFYFFMFVPFARHCPARTCRARNRPKKSCLKTYGRLFAFGELCHHHRVRMDRNMGGSADGQSAVSRIVNLLAVRNAIALGTAPIGNRPYGGRELRSLEWAI
jgi:hypothetical protein